MSMVRNRSRVVAAGGLAASLALGAMAPGTAALVVSSALVDRAAAAGHLVKPRGHVHVPAGILAGVPTGASPGGAPTQTYYPPFPVGFAADPYYSPPALVFAPPLVVRVPVVPADLPPPYWIGSELLPPYAVCFVPTDSAGQQGHYGSCAESYYRQFTNRPD
jgi:hypothetical protein